MDIAKDGQQVLAWGLEGFGGTQVAYGPFSSVWTVRYCFDWRAY